MNYFRLGVDLYVFLFLNCWEKNLRYEYIILINNLGKELKLILF